MATAQRARSRPRPADLPRASTPAGVVALVVAGLAVAACAGPSGDAAGRQPSPGVSGGSAAATPAPELSAPASPGRGTTGGTPGLSGTDLPTLGRGGPPKLPNDVVQPVTVRGTVRVAGACTLLTTDAGVWSLVGVPAPGVRDGQAVEVVGLPAPQEETACAGGPLHVRTVRPL